MNRRTLFATIAGLFCVRAKAEEKPVEIIGFYCDGNVFQTCTRTQEGKYIWESDKTYVPDLKHKNKLRLCDNTWSEKWGKQ